MSIAFLVDDPGELAPPSQFGELPGTSIHGLISLRASSFEGDL